MNHPIITPDETLIELLNRITYAAHWTDERAERERQDKQEHPYSDGYATGAWMTGQDAARTMHSFASALANVLGVDVPTRDEACDFTLGRAQTVIREAQERRVAEREPERREGYCTPKETA